MEFLFVIHIFNIGIIKLLDFKTSEENGSVMYNLSIYYYYLPLCDESQTI